MYCPKCGAQNIEDANFCRGCGSDLSLVPQAMTGQLPEKRATGHDAEGQSYGDYKRRRNRDKEPPRLDKAITNLFMGIAFLLVSFSVMLFAPGGRMWWYWMLIPAFTMLGGGVAEYVRYKQSRGEEVKLPGIPSRPELPPTPPARVSALPTRNTSELVQPPSVTEGTTRHLDLRADALPSQKGLPVEKFTKDA
ncbi:MAG TPA: zinc-ribbon domain-containing protein [Pyrinomonadaceae bacterium]|nr:zinc-ribbon domain-containing protein [Pyrinomonadaceae bacterium]